MSHDTLDRLSLPKRQANTSHISTSGLSNVKELGLPSPKCKNMPGNGIPPNPLPTWSALPLDAKLPMPPAPKNAVVLYTTNLGEKVR